MEYEDDVRAGEVHDVLTLGMGLGLGAFRHGGTGGKWTGRPRGHRFITLLGAILPPSRLIPNRSGYPADKVLHDIRQPHEQTCTARTTDIHTSCHHLSQRQ
jgi:hypothetical protein